MKYSRFIPSLLFVFIYRSFWFGLVWFVLFYFTSYTFSCPTPIYNVLKYFLSLDGDTLLLCKQLDEFSSRLLAFLGNDVICHINTLGCRPQRVQPREKEEKRPELKLWMSAVNVSAATVATFTWLLICTKRLEIVTAWTFLLTSTSPTHCADQARLDLLLARADLFFPTIFFRVVCSLKIIRTRVDYTFLLLSFNEPAAFMGCKPIQV